MIRLWLAHAENALGRLDAFRDVDFSRVRRVVFVCLGNICRSPYAELLARQHGMPSASFGLSAATGSPANPNGIATAAQLGHDLTMHSATDWGDFQMEEGDLLLVMEVRQARQLAQRLSGRSETVQIALLGFWAKPSRPHIHDPMTLSSDYFLTCYQTIESAVKNLAEAYRAGSQTRRH